MKNLKENSNLSKSSLSNKRAKARWSETYRNRTKFSYRTQKRIKIFCYSLQKTWILSLPDYFCLDKPGHWGTTRLDHKQYCQHHFRWEKKRLTETKTVRIISLLLSISYTKAMFSKVRSDSLGWKQTFKVPPSPLHLRL